MSNNNTTKDSNNRMRVLNKKEHSYNRALKKNTTIFNESVIAQVFYALQKAADKDMETDHSLSVANIRTLNIGQVQSLIHIHCKVSRSRDDVVDALQSLKQPRAVDVVETPLTSEIDGDTFDGIRLHYTDTPVDVNELTNSNNFEDIKSELSKVDLIKTEDWKAKALKLYEQHTIDRDTIQSLRAIIIDMSETLHEADPSARISMTSADLLDLVHSQQDMTDTPF